MPTRKKSKKKSTELKTDWNRLRSMTDAEIEASAAEDPDIKPTGEEFWRGAKLVMPAGRRTRPNRG